MTEKQIFVTGVTEYKSTDVEGVGTFRWVGNKCYLWVKNSTGGALTANRAYYHGTVNTLGFLSEIFTLGQSTKGTAINLLAGISQSAIPDTQYGWIQVFGEATVGVEGTTAVASSDNLKGVSGQIYLVKDTAAGTAPTNRRIGVALAAQAAGSVVATNIFINCL